MEYYRLLIYLKLEYNIDIKIMEKQSLYNKKALKKIYITILLLLCLISLISFISSIKKLSQSGALETENKLRKNPAYPYILNNVNNITPWMTFDYLNVVFKLKPEYLKKTLKISDPKYPNIRIDRYIKHNNLNSKFFLDTIKQSITNYPLNK